MRSKELTCSTPNVIYLITCAKCMDVAYVGQTTLPFRYRSKAHLSKLKRRGGGRLYVHFKKDGHGPDDALFLILDQFSPKNLDEKEVPLINNFAALTDTLNTQSVHVKNLSFPHY